MKNNSTPNNTPSVISRTHNTKVTASGAQNTASTAFSRLNWTHLSAVALALISAMSLSACLAPTASAAPTAPPPPQVNAIDIDDNIDVRLTSDSKGLTQATISVNHQSFDFTFTDDELKDLALLKAKLSSLPEDKQAKVAALLHDTTQGVHVRYIRSDLSEEAQLKLEKLHQALAIKEAEMQKSVMAMETRIKSSNFNQAEFEQKSRELEEKAKELEALISGPQSEFSIEMQSLSGDIQTLVEQIVEIEDVEGMSGRVNKLMILHDNDTDIVQHLQSLIDTNSLSDKQKQQLRDALN